MQWALNHIVRVRLTWCGGHCHTGFWILDFGRVLVLVLIGSGLRHFTRQKSQNPSKNFVAGSPTECVVGKDFLILDHFIAQNHRNRVKIVWSWKFIRYSSENHHTATLFVGFTGEPEFSDLFSFSFSVFWHQNCQKIEETSVSCCRNRWRWWYTGKWRIQNCNWTRGDYFQIRGLIPLFSISNIRYLDNLRAELQWYRCVHMHQMVL